jgi:hypothetical protein
VDTGVRGYRLCPLCGDVADGGVDPLTIVVALDVGEQVAPSGIQIGVFALVDEFGFSVPKKLSICALSQQFALRLIDWIYRKKGKELFAYFKKYYGDPAATAYDCLGKHYREIAIEQFRNQTLQKQRMNSGGRYQHIAKDCAVRSRRFVTRISGRCRFQTRRRASSIPRKS